MKIFVKIIFGLIGLFWVSLIAFILYFTFLIPDYYTRIVPGSTLESDESGYIKKAFNFRKDERIILFYGYGSTIKDGGSFLSNRRVVYYLQGEDPADSEQALLTGIKQVTLSNEDAYWRDGAILIKRKNSTEFSIPVTNADYDSKKYYERIMKLMKKQYLFTKNLRYSRLFFATTTIESSSSISA